MVSDPPSKKMAFAGNCVVWETKGKDGGKPSRKGESLQSSASGR